MAEWILGGEPSVDLSDVDIRRFAPFTGNRRALAERTAETLGLHYAMRWPRQELQTARPLRTSPLYDTLAAQGAVFGSKNGWERVNYLRPAGSPAARDTLDRPDWLAWMQHEQRATREAVALYDQSSFSKLLVQGRDALAFLQSVCAADVDAAIGKMVYTPLLNARGGYESDLTVMRLASDRFMLVTGSAQATRDMDWLQRHLEPQQWVGLSDVSAQTCVLSLMGPRSGELMARVSPDDVSAAALPFAMTREIDLGFARVRAARMSYVGGPGYELYVPVEMTRHVYQTLQQAGQDLGLRNAGYYALDALRIERGRRAWGAELGPDETPLETGMLRGIALDKPTAFIGQAALRERLAQGKPLAKKLVRLQCSDPAVYLWGGEPLLRGGQTIGEITSAGWGWEAGRCVALAYVRGDLAAQPLKACAATADVWGEPVAVVIDELG
jgi:4-methylaminobutanoate oxidase (formaldehyde-forming)